MPARRLPIGSDVSAPARLSDTSGERDLPESSQSKAVPEKRHMQVLPRLKTCDVCARIHRIPEENVPRAVPNLHADPDWDIRQERLL